MTELRDDSEPPLSDLLGHLAPVDLVLIEGYKRESHPKVEAWRSENGKLPLAGDNPTIRAVASDIALPDLDRPRLDLDDTAAIADFIAQDLAL